MAVPMLRAKEETGDVKRLITLSDVEALGSSVRRFVLLGTTLSI